MHGSTNHTIPQSTEQMHHSQTLLSLSKGKMKQTKLIRKTVFRIKRSMWIVTSFDAFIFDSILNCTSRMTSYYDFNGTKQKIKTKKSKHNDEIYFRFIGKAMNSRTVCGMCTHCHLMTRREMFLNICSTHVFNESLNIVFRASR